MGLSYSISSIHLLRHHGVFRSLSQAGYVISSIQHCRNFPPTQDRLSIAPPVHFFQSVKENDSLCLFHSMCTQELIYFLTKLRLTFTFAIVLSIPRSIGHFWQSPRLPAKLGIALRADDKHQPRAHTPAKQSCAGLQHQTPQSATGYIGENDCTTVSGPLMRSLISKWCISVTTCNRKEISVFCQWFWRHAFVV